MRASYGYVKESLMEKTVDKVRVELTGTLRNPQGYSVAKGLKDLFASRSTTSLHAFSLIKFTGQKAVETLDI